jgi:hypothetical protein
VVESRTHPNLGLFAEDRSYLWFHLQAQSKVSRAGATKFAGKGFGVSPSYLIFSLP